MQLQPATHERTRRPKRRKPQSTHNASANASSIAETIKHLGKTDVSIFAYQAFIQLADEILPKDNQINITTSHDELGACLQVTIKLPNADVDECLRWHDDLLSQWVERPEFDTNLLFQIEPLITPSEGVV